ncbi:VWA domain-containing protein [Flavobacterium sp. MFBS3-15]|uniref:TerY-C metal binding domain-containing protein n=1 Tax=Flavobacterium sp. MFBS3-15 TaxID=2989816 RepID=UPI0022354617|nr:TerY-C metal binding domain-containing protein [Flavobacterium sp. MFBS3-15]MCW4467749.1 VWA domain-containing protein [Flavobacterium sp. MFBS3-15]
MRRLPIYFLIDISESMVGEPIQQVEEGLATIIQALKSDPHALETVWVSIIVFAGQAKTLVPLQEIVSFYPPKFPIGSGTSLSKGLGHLMYELRSNIVKTTYEQKGDWKPIVFLFTDGVPTDDTSAAIAEWKQNWARTANMVAISFGDETDMRLLGELSNDVMHFKNTSAQSYKEFFRWVTDSIKTSSISVENNSTGFELAKTDDETISKIDLSKPGDYDRGGYVDDNFVVFAAQCQNTKRPYLMKYGKVSQPSNFGGMNFETRAFRLMGAYPVDNSYYELADKSYENNVSSEELIGAPTCPCCGNQYGLAVCSCRKIHCIGDEEVSTCPWCGSQGRYTSGGGNNGGFNIGRAQG